MIIKVLQVNLNRSQRSHDLLEARCRENQTDISLISEPRCVPDNLRWYGSNNRLAAIYWNPRRVGSCVLKMAREFYVIAECKGLYFTSIYCSPSGTMETFKRTLRQLKQDLSDLKAKSFVIGGDFNARSTTWGDTCVNTRGAYLDSWAVDNRFLIANRGKKPTCIRHRGQSIVDTTWTDVVTARKVRNWRVATDVEVLSDHQVIEYQISNTDAHSKSNRPRWNFKRADLEELGEVMAWNCIDFKEEFREDANRYNDWLVQNMNMACNAVVPRNVPTDKRSVYWWNEDIRLARENSIRLRRALTRARKKQRSDLEIHIKLTDYKEARSSLQRLINKAKATAWKELIASINQDPWGLPYRLVLNKLRSSTPSVSEVLDPSKLETLLNSLFPCGDDDRQQQRAYPLPAHEWFEELEITKGELREIYKKSPKGKATGPDDLPVAIWAGQTEDTQDRIISLFNTCMRTGRIPDAWKKARLVLIPKSGGSIDCTADVIKARPICLLNDIGKMFERILAERINYWMTQDPSRELSDRQFGFRKARSTNDAILEAKEITLGALADGDYAVMINLDVENAFNSVSWRAIKEALAKRELPPYIQNLVDNYLSDRWIEYTDSTGRSCQRRVTAGVPQGSVLGPLLWNLAYDSILDIVPEPGCHTLCFADDTTVICVADSPRRTIARANVMLAKIISGIKDLGLKVAPAKTAAVFFAPAKFDPERLPPLLVDGIQVQAGPSLKSLGIIIDKNWSFQDHFAYAEEKAARVTKALYRIMPNLRGPNFPKRKLYAETVLSVLLYGAPVWAEEYGELAKHPTRRTPYKEVVRTIAQRTICAYRTVAYDAATLIAKIPPIHLLADLRKRVYLAVKEARAKEARANGTLDARKERRIRLRAHKTMTNQWKERLQDPKYLYGQTSKLAILPSFEEWLNCTFNHSNFRLTQLLTGHGSLGAFLCKIKKKDDDECTMCEGHHRDTSDHTLLKCSRWTEERTAFYEKVGIDPEDDNTTIADITTVSLLHKENWLALEQLSNHIMGSKELSERRNIFSPHRLTRARIGHPSPHTRLANTLSS